MKHTKKLLSLLLVLCLILSLSCTAFAADEAKPLTGKTVIPFATSGGSGIEKAERSLKSHCPQANWKKGKLLNHMDAAAWTKSVLNSGC